MQSYIKLLEEKMERFTHLLIGALLMNTLIVTAAFGGGSFHIFEIDAEASAKGTAFVSEADNPSAVYYNPAGLTQLEDRTHISLGTDFLQSLVKHTDSSGTETQMRINTHVIPHLYIVDDFGLEDFKIGFGSSTNWGLSTEWAKDSFARYVSTKTEIVNFDNYISLAYALNEDFSIGVGGVIDYSEISKSNNINQLSTDGGAQLKGDDVGFGWNVSGLYKFNEQHQIGLKYQSEIDLEYEGTISLDGLNTTSLAALSGSSYNAVFGGSSYSTAAEAELILPQQVSLGYTYKYSEDLLFNFGVDWVNWSSLKQEVVSFPEETDATRLAVLRTATTIPHDYKNVYSFKFGGEYMYTPDLALRVGYYFNQSPIPDETYDTTVPDADVHGINAGFGYRFTDNYSLDFAWTTMLFEDRDINNTVGNSVGADLDGTYENIINIAIVTFNFVY